MKEIQMIKRGVSVLAILGLGSFAIAGVPPNDMCSGAIPIDLDSTTVSSNVDATNEAETPPDGICQLYSDPDMQSTVWFSVEVEAAGRLSLSTCNMASFDTRIFVLTSCDISSLVACNDDFSGCGGFSSYLDIDILDGEVPVTLYIAVGGYGGVQGAFTLVSTFTGDTSPPDNDACADAIPVAIGSTTAGSNEFSSSTAGTPDGGVCNLYSDCCIQSSVWYSLEVAEETVLDISTCNASTFDTRLFVLTTCGDITSLVACNDDYSGCSGNSSRVFMEAAPGTYYIAVAGYNGAQGTFDLSVGECSAAEIEGVFDFAGNFDPTTGDATLRSINDDDTWYSFGTDTIGGEETGVLTMVAAHNEYQALALEYAACPNPINAGFINTFTIIMDLKLDGFQWAALWNSNDGDPYNYNDAEVFVTPDGQFWVGNGGGYVGDVGTIVPETWYRIAMVEDLDTGMLNIYVDGVLEASAAVVTLDGQHALYIHRMMILGDNNGETSSGSVSSVFFADRALTPKEIAAYGGPTAGGLGGDGGDCPEDLNGDNIIDGADLTVFLGSWGPCSGCPSDFTGDGLVDGADLTIILGKWGPC